MKTLTALIGSLVISTNTYAESHLLKEITEKEAQWNSEQHVWQPKHSSDTTTAINVRIVAHADKMTRHGFGGHNGGKGNTPNSYRYGASKATSPAESIPIFHCKDVDGDGDMQDDYIAAIPFSLTEEMGLKSWPFTATYPNRISGRFYGGVSWHISNSTPKEYSFCKEMGINADHSLSWFDMRAESQPLQGSANEKKSDSHLQLYWAMLWQKKDFLADGDKYPVTFNDESRLGSMCIRTYWYGYDDVRMIVKDGDKLFISENNFDIPTKGYTKKKPGRQFVLYPTKANWAPYTPDPKLIRFDKEQAQFSKHNFTDVQGVGWYLAKDTLAGPMAHIKWYGFEADAVVNRPDYPSTNIDMAAISGKDGVQDFYMATCETPYLLWKKIHRFGDAPFQTFEARYNFMKNGDMGSMQNGGKHGQQEPATNFTLYDALSMCNTLSLMEGREACYYIDPEYSIEFKGQHLQTLVNSAPSGRRNYDNPTYTQISKPTIYVKWAADGFRLPTVSEWSTAFAQGGNTRANEQTSSTYAVGTGTANTAGLYDMLGNAAELVWNYGDNCPPETTTMTVLGGSFLHTDNPGIMSISPYGDDAFYGRGDIGLRFVRRDSGLAAPASGKTSAHTWTITAGHKTPMHKNTAEPKQILKMASLPQALFTRGRDNTQVQVDGFDMAIHPITYGQWMKVYFWATEHGYSFSHDGDMGSMYYYQHTHSPDEPVTRITWHDMVVWCNALSEMENKVPVYYTDDHYTNIYKNAFTYRPIKVDSNELATNTGQWFRKHTNTTCGNGNGHLEPFLFERWDIDGYRLPTEAEYEYAIGGGTKDKYFWGSNPAEKDDYVWDWHNAGGRTHPVGQKKPNSFGLYDILGNVCQATNSGAKARKDRDPLLDTNNPTASRYAVYGLDEKEVSYKRPPTILAGCSWLYGAPEYKSSHGIMNEPQNYLDNLHYFSEVGFRPVAKPVDVLFSIDGKVYTVTGPARTAVAIQSGKKITIDGRIEGNTLNAHSVQGAE